MAPKAQIKGHHFAWIRWMIFSFKINQASSWHKAEHNTCHLSIEFELMETIIRKEKKLLTHLRNQLTKASHSHNPLNPWKWNLPTSIQCKQRDTILFLLIPTRSLWKCANTPKAFHISSLSKSDMMSCFCLLVNRYDVIIRNWYNLTKYNWLLFFLVELQGTSPRNRLLF